MKRRPPMFTLTTKSARQRGLLLAIGLLCVGVFTFGTTQSADAASYRYVVINKSAQSNTTGPVFASCQITSNVGTCTISTGKSITRTIQVSLGASRAEVSVGLSISSAESVTTTVACASPALSAGQTWRGRALGTRFTYKLQKQEGIHPRVGGGVTWVTPSTPRVGGGVTWVTRDTSGQLSAFNPSSTSISCGL